MVETRRKKAAAAQDGAVKENKAEPPAPQTQTPTKRGRRGRPPKNRPEASTPSTSGPTDVSNLEQKDDASSMKLLKDCESSNDSVLNSNEADSFLEKEDDAEAAPSQKKVKKEIVSPEKANHSPIPPPPPLSKRRSSAKIKIKKEPVEQVPVAELETTEAPVERAKTPEAAPPSPPHPEDPQPSATVSMKNEPAQEKQEPVINHACESAQEKEPVAAVKNEPESEEPAPKIHNLTGPETTQEEGHASKASIPPLDPNKLMEDLINDSESMDIADSDSDNGDTAEARPSTSSTNMQQELNQNQIHVDVDHSLSVNVTGSASWEQQSEEKKPENPLSSPMRRPRIHFLHPAYQSFASDPVQVHASPQPPPPPEPAPIKETENGFSMGFKPMAFKSKLGPKTNPLMQAGTASNPIPPRPVATPAVVVPDSTTLPTTQFSPQKRNTNFGSSASNLPPPTMVDLPKLSFFNMPSSNSVESDSPSKEPAEKPPKPACASILPAAPRISDAKIYALKAKTERIAQDIARRHHVDRQKEEREDHDRRREERERRHKKAEEESKQRQREDDKRRARDRELRRKEREKEEERMQAQRDLERKQKEEESKIREQERKAREEERRAKEEERKKEEEKRIREEDMKVPPYEKIDECKFLMRNAHKKKTDSMICDCVHSNNNCSDGNCVNRAMQTECPSSCKAKCKNQRFAKRKYALVEAFHTGTSKGCGLRALKDIKKGRFIIEYVGEVVERDDYEKRKLRYAADKKHKHHYLCDTGVYTIDATVYGNDSRFVNHSCDPNAICEKWSVPKTPGDISRIGFFAKRNIMAGEEITFNYQFVNYGYRRDAQQCFCGASNCTGWIGQKPDQFSSDEEDDEDDPNRQIQIDEDLDERLEEDMYEMSGSEKIKYLDEELGSLASKSKKYARKVITIVSKMEDYEQRSNLLKSMFCQDIDYNTRMHYAKEGMSTLIGEWLEPVDFSLENLNLVKVCLQTLQTDGFTSCLKTNRFLIDTVNRWMNMTWNDWMDVQVVTDALVTCVADPTKEYSVVGEEFHNEITINLQRVKEMMVRLMKHCGAISFKIPKKARDQETKEGESKSQINVSSHTHESNRSGAISPYQRHHHSSSYYERDSHPRFFNNGNDVHQYRFGGYHGNNYKENYQRRISSRDSYRERRRPGRRSRSRSRSSSPQMYKRRKLEEREGRHRSPLYERRGGSPSARTPGSSASGERAAGKSESKLHAMSDASSSSLHAAAAPAAHGQPVPHVVAYPNTHDPNGHPVPVGYPVPGYEAYAGMVDANGMYVYHPSAGYYSSYHQHHGALTLENLPPFEKLNELYETATVNQLNERLHKAKKEVDLIKAIIARKLHEEQVVSTARMKAAEEARALEALNRSKYVWARAKSDTGETYYYNKVTKETQWSPPSAEQGLLDPNDRASPDTTVVAAEEPKPTVVEQPIVEPVFEVKMEPVEVPTSVEEASVDVNPSRDRERDRDRDRDRERDRDRDRERERDHGRDRDRDRREGSRHHEHSSQRHDGLSRDERRTRDFKTHLEKVVRSVVKVAIRDLRDATHDKTTWLIKMVTKEMYKRESQQPGFDCRFTEDSERKVRNYTKSLIDRKLKTDDLWKGYSEGR